MTLRDYQVDLETRTKEAMRDVQAVCVVAPTGAGKTRVFVHIAKNAAAKKNSVFILVHRAELVKQTSDALRLQGVPHGIIWRGVPESNELVQVVMVNTFVKRMEKWWKPKLIIVDECHHIVAGTWRKIAEWAEGSKILGFTATPCRLDGQGLGRSVGGIFDKIVEGPSVLYLQDRGFLARAEVYSLPVLADFSKCNTKGTDYIIQELVNAVNTPEVIGDAIEHYKRICNGAPTVAFCANIEHAKHVSKLFNDSGINATHIDGTLSDRERQSRIKALAEGEINVCASVALVDEGFDLPAITCALLLTSTLSLSRYIQRIGRVLRPAPGKDFAKILDFVGDVMRPGFGLPHAERSWSLEGKNKKNKGEAPDPVRQCPKCYRAFDPAPKCPYCGFIFPVNKEEQVLFDRVGDLQLVEEMQVSEAQIAIQVAKDAKKRKQSRIGRARRLSELYELAAEFNYKKTWAEHIYEARNGKEELRKAKIEIDVNERHKQAKELRATRAL